MPWWLLLVGIGLVAGRRRGAGSDNTSHADPASSSPGALGLPVDPAWLPAVDASLSTRNGVSTWLYYWGGPSPVNPPGLVAGQPFAGPLLGDCSGSARALYISAGKLPLTAERFTSSSIAGSALWRKVADSDVKPGDLLVYDGHVTVCVGGAGADTCTVWSMSGGSQKTFGKDVNAHPKLYRGARYRSGYLGAYRRV